MNDTESWKGIAIFFLIGIVMLIISLTAFQMTGSMGIEERFTTALGIFPGEEKEGIEEAGNGWSGFSIEGNAAWYLLVLICLLVSCTILYRRI